MRPESTPAVARPFGRLLAVVVVSGALLLGGCASMGTRPPTMTLEQVVQLSRDGVAPAEIINQLKATRTVLALTGSQYARLREEGVADEVLDFIQQSYVRAVEIDSRIRYQSPYWGWGPPYPYPYRPYRGYWPYWYYW